MDVPRSTVSGRTPLVSLLSLLTLIGVGITIQVPLYDRSVVPMDEGHLAAAADWMLQGKALYRDIHTGIFPGIYWLTQSLFWLADPDLRLTRGAQFFVNLALIIVLWRISIRMLNWRWAFFPPLAYLALIASAFPVLCMFNYSTLAMTGGLTSLLFLLRYLERARVMDGILCGLFLAACALTKQNFGVLAGLGIALGLLATRSTSSLADRSWTASFAPIVLAGASATICAAIALASQGIFPEFLGATLLDLGSSQLRSFNNPIPPLFGSHPLEDGRFLFLYSPPILFNMALQGEPLWNWPITSHTLSLAIRLSYGLPLLGLVAGAVWLGLNRRGSDPRLHSARVCSLLYGLAFFPGLFPSAIWSHLAFVLPPLFPGFALLGEHLGARLRRRGRSWAIAWSLTTGMGAIALAGFTVEALRIIPGWYPEPLGLERVSLKVSPSQAALLRDANRFVQNCASEQPFIFVAPDLPLIYFMTRKQSPSPYDLTIPGNVDSARIIAALEHERVRCVVFNSRMYAEFPAFEELFPDLELYLRENYRRGSAIGGSDSAVFGLVRNEKSAP